MSVRTPHPLRLRALLAVALLSAAGAQAQRIEFTYFYPDRYVNNVRLGERDALLKTMPRDGRGDRDVERMAESYGLIYVPGETIDIHLRDVAGTKIDQITCTSAMDEASLPVERQGDALWQVTIPERENTDEPYLHVYRVQALAGDRVIAERGFAVTVPFSGMRAWGDESVFNRKISFLEWFNGSNPFHRMTNRFLRSDWRRERFPLKNRPYAYTDVGGLKGMYGGIRRNYQSVFDRDLEQEKPITSDDYYRDPSMEWNIWWHYYGQGASRYEGEWQWGPFAAMSAERFGAGGADVGYGDLRRFNSVLPNGMLWWHWSAYGLQKNMEMEMMPRDDRRPAYNPVDGWSEAIDYPGRRALRRTEEVGVLPLYYEYCRAHGKALSWAQDYPTAQAFMQAQFEEGATPGQLNDYFHQFVNSDVLGHNHAQLINSRLEAFHRVRGEDKTPYRGTHMNPYGQIDQFPFKFNSLDYRPRHETFMDLGFQTIVRGGDYSHTGYITHPAGGGWAKARGYRGIGYRAAGIMALFPDLLWAHDSINYLRNRPADQGNYSRGTPVPGNEAFDNAYGNGGKDPETHLGVYTTIIDDGTSFRRFDMFERLPMYYNNAGKLSMREFTQCFGSGPDYLAARTPRWNTQMILGMQVMEIPDRVRPIGGVFVFDSNNADDRAEGREFVTQPGENFTPYLSLVLDQLGIVTLANGETAEKIDPGIPRIYAPRRHDGEPRLVAEVHGKTITAPYTGPEMYTMDNPTFRKFVQRVRDAHPGGWPIRTTGGFVATAWHSSLGVFLYVENPMSEAGDIHVAREGTIRLRIDDLPHDTQVFDLCGGRTPDVRALASDELDRNGEWITIHLDWPRGDARLYWIH